MIGRSNSTYRSGSRSVTIRKRLEVMSRQCEMMENDKFSLQKALSDREHEISSLLRLVCTTTNLSSPLSSSLLPSLPPYLPLPPSPQAYKKGYRYPQYMFLTYAWYPPQWWYPETSPDFNCTGEERLEVLNHTLAFLHFPFVRFGDVNASTDVNVVRTPTLLSFYYGYGI